MLLAPYTEFAAPRARALSAAFSLSLLSSTSVSSASEREHDDVFRHCTSFDSNVRLTPSQGLTGLCVPVPHGKNLQASTSPWVACGGSAVAGLQPLGSAFGAWPLRGAWSSFSSFSFASFHCVLALPVQVGEVLAVHGSAGLLLPPSAASYCFQDRSLTAFLPHSPLHRTQTQVRAR